MSQIIDPGKMMKAAATVQPVLPVLTPDMLRDWFAAAALIGVCEGAEEMKNGLCIKKRLGDWAPDIAEAAYDIADAMMKVREQK